MSDASLNSSFQNMLWDVTELDVAFGAAGERFLSRRKDDLKTVPKKYQDIAQSLFFSGGRIADFGLSVKPDVDGVKFHRCLKAMLCSFEPSHEEKSASAGLLIMQCCSGQGHMS